VSRQPLLRVLPTTDAGVTPIDLRAWVDSYVAMILRKEGITAPPPPEREAA
jgi:hypothetical protein